MGFEELSDLEKRLFRYIQENDFEKHKWNTRKAAEALGCSEREIYEALAVLSKEVRDHIWIHYKDGGIRISVEEPF